MVPLTVSTVHFFPPQLPRLMFTQELRGAQRLEPLHLLLKQPHPRKPYRCKKTEWG